MTDKDKIEKLKRRFRRHNPGLFPGGGEVDPVMASLCARQGAVYCTENQYRRGDFRDFLREQACDLIRTKYHRKVAGADHAANIGKLAAKAGKAHGDILLDGRFRFGIAQKYLNLQLKGLWALGKIPTPPHCPFDSMVLSSILRLGLPEGQNWTVSDSRASYNKWVKAAQKAANALGYPNIAVWELAACDHYREYGLPIPRWKEFK